ncbi:hypothetical protein [Listeria newyorkensis]|uniref:hypothetical protein n=1 Tax=Listeria newyorkensis TaxID=1497681 RepID=UPI00051D7A29|nr:hypothetical protein [Listeria newyorkensis]KGL44496.1 hypothetical protein EP56_07805 [Listeriaceae bacterium FSL A5-0209]KGL45695.1 hypothetical protein EP58_03105 [Listeria newyorkensis]SQC55375.1 Uncharacterised protein [Listeria newyorkensis]
MFKNKLDRVTEEEIQLKFELNGLGDDYVGPVYLNGHRYIREDLIEDKTEESPMAYDGSYVQVMQNEDTTTIITKDFTLIRGKEGHMWIVDKEGIRFSKNGSLINTECAVDENGRLLK